MKIALLQIAASAASGFLSVLGATVAADVIGVGGVHPDAAQTLVFSGVGAAVWGAGNAASRLIQAWQERHPLP